MTEEGLIRPIEDEFDKASLSVGDVDFGGNIVLSIFFSKPGGAINVFDIGF